MIFISAILIGVVGLGTADPEFDKKLLTEGIKHAADCASSNNIQFDVCAEMFKKETDLKDKKFDGCKCWIPCVAKKMNAMKEDGTWNIDEVKKIIESLHNVEWKAEAEKVLPLCKDVKGTHCEAGFEAFHCVMNHSDKARNFVESMMMTLSG
ncbi:Hypothetical protein NTJ_06038 [Nesidiocoris tenuis]|uniref:Uncharacterized protein n=1 Tax=Nesidiocoris tenuis TaxID=355587 RepID=A0ABN7AP79_9HEMI|nr:Hypothetical protein NTJ_06038 [Nesidiocoris tenuis]